MMWWFWHLLYDNRLFGRWLWHRVQDFQMHRNFGYVEGGIYGLNRRWQLQQRSIILIRRDGDHRLISPRSRI